MTASPAFVMYKMSALIAKARFEAVSLAPDFSLDVPAMLAAIREHQPAVVFLAYPNNPTGNLFDDASIEAILAEAPGLVVIDEAYQTFARRSLMGRLAQFPNLMVMRTLSKLGLAGLRLGYAAARPEWMHEIDKVRGPYNVGVLTQKVACTILDHADVLQEQAQRIIAERERLHRELAALPGVEPFASEANFVLARVPDAQKVYDGLMARKVLIRTLHGGHPLLERCVRFTVGTPEENDAVLAAMKDVLGVAVR
jgi:histidinol-phosphate aminotransferase